MLTTVIVLAVIAGLVGIDQAIKLWAIANLQGQSARPFLPLGSFDWMHLRYLENSGAAFSMLSGNRGFLIIFPCIMIAVCLYALHRLGKTHRWLYFALPLIAAGGIGNLIDRVFRGGKVVDYFDFQLCNFAVFNFADICVTIGVIFMMIGILFLEKDAPEAKKLPQAERIPYAPTMPDAPELPKADELPEAAEAKAAPLRDTLEEAEDSEDAAP